MNDRLKLQEQVLTLPSEDRAAVASALLHSLEPPAYTFSDEEVQRRLEELENGEVAEISHEELLARIKRPSSR